MRVLPCGDAAVLLELEDRAGTSRVHAGLCARPPAGVEELVPGTRTVLVRFDPAVTSGEQLARAARATPPLEPGSATSALVEIQVVYDGEDLDEVAELTGLSREEVVARHRSGTYEVAFCGFAPGFAYLTGLPAELHVPRRATPRVAVPAGSVAIAGEYAAVYPRSSPGGWQLLGRTDVALWDLTRDPPSLLAPGTRVRFVA